MRDEFAGQRLPDLPNAGYSTTRQCATSDMVMFWLRGVERDRPLLLSIVVDGIDKWRKTASAVWSVGSGGRATAMTRELVDRVFDYMVLLAGANPAHQLLQLEQHAHLRKVTSYDFRKRTRQAILSTQARDRQTQRREEGKFGKGRKFFT